MVLGNVLPMLLLAQVAGTPTAEPVQEPEDAEAFRVYREEGPTALTPAQQARLRFWGFYYGYRGHMGKMSDGAIFADDFDGPELSLFQRTDDPLALDELMAQGGRWRVWNTDKGISIRQEDGMLVIAGRSTIPEGLNFNGLVGRVHGDTDVVLVAEMKAVSPAVELPGFHVGMVHLCGSSPDYFNELCFGREHDGSVGWVQRHANGKDEPLQSIPPRGDERERFYTVRLEHDAANETSRGWLKVGDEWLEVGEARPLVMSSAKVELKVNVPTLDAEVECRFDNCRMYGRPQTHPLRVLLHPSPFSPVDVSKARVELYLDGQDEPAAEGAPDRFGWVNLTLPADRAYPAAGRFVIKTDSGKFEHSVESKGVEGLYPGDVWSAQLNESEMAGNDGWWREFRQMLDDKLRELGE